MNLRLGQTVHRIDMIADGAATTFCERGARLPEARARAAFGDVQLTAAAPTCETCDRVNAARVARMRELAR